ncbi:uncharacterized protein yc1106_02081 [Curvularia clavata]|uniref:Uncharacterized protein n=1 Tax=Curvularia clavata TaxID=95742 RepID=A0A9Q8Z313_CURCL|nr:uncharacterized protein yc1106_02081 [Curvularia clavata]
MKSHIIASIAARMLLVTARVIEKPKVWPMPDTNDLRPATAFWDDDYASESEWKIYTAKGGALMCGLSGSDETAGILLKDTRTPTSASSIFTSNFKNTLATWHWRHVNPASFSCSFSTHWQFPNAMRSLGISGTSVAEGGDNTCYRVEHWDPEMRDEHGNQIPAVNQWYSVPGVERKYRATKAHYEFGLNFRGGALFAMFLESPQAAARSLWYSNQKSPSKDDLPLLRAFSDVLWGFWAQDNPDVRNVRFFFMIGISNDVSNRIIASCLRDVEATLGVWPGTSFEAESEQGHALIGSPNGAAFAYFLMQHKAQLGQKTITKITVFRPENGDDNDFVDASLCFHVEEGGQAAVEEKRSLGKDGEQSIFNMILTRSDLAAYERPLRVLTLLTTVLATPLLIATTVISLNSYSWYYYRSVTTFCFGYIPLALTALASSLSLVYQKKHGKAPEGRFFFVDGLATLGYLGVLIPIWGVEIGKLRAPGFGLLAGYTTAPMIVNISFTTTESRVQETTQGGEGYSLLRGEEYLDVDADAEHYTEIHTRTSEEQILPESESKEKSKKPMIEV